MLRQLATERGPWGRGVEAVDLDSVYWTLSSGQDDRGRRLKLVRNPHGCRHTIASERTRGVTRPTASPSRTPPRWGWRASSKIRFRNTGGSSGIPGATGDLVPADDAVGAQQEVGEARWGEGQERERVDDRREVRAISAQTSLWRDLCKYQRKSVKVAKVGEGSGDDAEETEEEEEEEDDEVEDDSDSGGGSGGEGDSDDAEWDGSLRGRRGTDSSAGVVQAIATFSAPADVIRPFCATPGLVTQVGHRLVFMRSPESGSGLGCAEELKDVHAGVRVAGRGKQGDQTLPDNYKWALRPAPSTSWPTSALRRALFRPYGGMRFAALEMWFRGGCAEDEGGAEEVLLLGLPSEPLARALHQALRRTRPPALEPFLGRLPATVVARSNAATWGASAAGGVGMFVGQGPRGRGSVLGSGGGVGTVAAAAEAARTPLTQAWVRRRCGVTNFDYLRGLNAAAGRTTSDLSRYPVFPWVLSERAWRAEELDLRDERNFRDLAWPMGAQRPGQREVRQRGRQREEA